MNPLVNAILVRKDATVGIIHPIVILAILDTLIRLNKPVFYNF